MGTSPCPGLRSLEGGRNEEVVLYANANLPNGSTLEQMNTLVKRVETYLSGFKEIKQFHASVYNARRANLQIYFKKEYQHSGFPYTLKANLIGKVSELGGGSWDVYGLQDQGFSNDVRESDITQVRFADIWDTYHCGLSKAVRKRLQKMGIKRKLPVVFSTEQADPKAVLLTEDEMNKKSTCGTVSYMPAVFGCYLAEYVLKRL